MVEMFVRGAGQSTRKYTARGFYCAAAVEIVALELIAVDTVAGAGSILPGLVCLGATSLVFMIALHQFLAVHLETKRLKRYARRHDMEKLVHEEGGNKAGATPVECPPPPLPPCP